MKDKSRTPKRVPCPSCNWAYLDHGKCHNCGHNTSENSQSLRWFLFCRGLIPQTTETAGPQVEEAAWEIIKALLPLEAASDVWPWGFQAGEVVEFNRFQPENDFGPGVVAPRAMCRGAVPAEAVPVIFSGRPLTFYKPHKLTISSIDPDRRPEVNIKNYVWPGGFQAGEAVIETENNRLGVIANRALFFPRGFSPYEMAFPQDNIKEGLVPVFFVWFADGANWIKPEALARYSPAPAAPGGAISPPPLAVPPAAGPGKLIRFVADPLGDRFTHLTHPFQDSTLCGITLAAGTAVAGPYEAAPGPADCPKCGKIVEFCKPLMPHESSRGDLDAYKTDG